MQVMDPIPEEAAEFQELLDYLGSLPPDLDPWEAEELALIHTLKQAREKREREQGQRPEPPEPPK
jgi:hypothetical protein